MENNSIKQNYAKNENEMKVYLTKFYNKEIINEKKIINKNYIIFETIGKGSFWTVKKVKRNLVSKEGKLLDNNYYVFKKGQLNKKNFFFDEENNNNINNEKRIGLREFNLLKNICNQNIPRLFECIIDTKKNKIVFVMEFCDLGSLLKANDDNYEYNLNLMKFLYEKIFSVNENNKKIEFEKLNYENYKNFFEFVACEIFKQLINALFYLHINKKIAHLDIKPDNILFKSFDINEEKDNYIKLTDFSNSLKFNDLNEKINYLNGTPAFLPPETEEQENFNPFKCDIFSLGASIYAFLFNSLEFKNYKEKIKNINNIKLKNLLENSLNFDPNKRFDITQLKNLL